MANVFVSHRTQDSDLAHELAKALRIAGHVVRLDVWDISLGDSIIQWMDRGLTDSTYVVLCYSSAGILSPWMGREWMSTLARQLNGSNVRLLPVRLSGGQPPALLADIRYADLVVDWNRGVQDLLAAIR